MHGRLILSLAVLGCFAGCTDIPTPEEPAAVEITLGQSFDAATTGTIAGRVVWDGDIPAGEEHVVRAIAFNPFLHKNPARYTTPHLPRINPANRGVANAVVFLRTVDPRRSRPWDHARARVEFSDRKLEVVQGDNRTGIGFVRRGDSIDIVNRDTEYHNLRARGAAVFAMPLGESNRVHERKLSQAGPADLTCAAGYYWLHAHLLVVEHPYYVRTDADGKFTLPQVPAGEYEVVCWLPNWKVIRKEVDPETAITARQVWADAMEQTRRTAIRAQGRSDITFKLATP